MIATATRKIELVAAQRSGKTQENPVSRQEERPNALKRAYRRVKEWLKEPGTIYDPPLVG